VYHLKQEDADTTDTSAEAVNATVVEELSLQEEALRYFHHFNRGFKGDELATNFTNCGNRSVFWYFAEYQTYKVKMVYGDASENTLNSTLFLQNTTNMANICTDTTENIFYFFKWKQEQFGTF